MPTVHDLSDPTFLDLYFKPFVLCLWFCEKPFGRPRKDIKLILRGAAPQRSGGPPTPFRICHHDYADSAGPIFCSEGVQGFAGGDSHLNAVCSFHVSIERDGPPRGEVRRQGTRRDEQKYQKYVSLGQHSGRLTDPSSPAWGRTRYCNIQRRSKLRPHVRCSAELG